MRAVRDISTENEPEAGDVAWELEDQTVERQVRVKARTHPLYATRLTRRTDRIDPALLAIACGDVDPDDGHRIVSRRDLSVRPGGAAPAAALLTGRSANDAEAAYDDVTEAAYDDVTEVEDGWLVADVMP